MRATRRARRLRRRHACRSCAGACTPRAPQALLTVHRKLRPTRPRLRGASGQSRGVSRAAFAARTAGALWASRSVTSVAQKAPACLGLRKTFNSDKTAARETSFRLAASTQKPCAVSSEVARRASRAKAFTRRAPCRKVLGSGSLDRQAQYNGARPKKASRESPARRNRTARCGKTSGRIRRRVPSSSPSRPALSSLRGSKSGMACPRSFSV